MEREDDQRIALLLKYYHKELESQYGSPDEPPRMTTDDPAHKNNLETMKKELGIK